LEGAALSQSENESEESEEEMTAEERARLKEREELRRERARQREKELRLSHMGKEAKSKSKYLTLNRPDRDISEKIALGLAQPTISADSLYDQRLFNQSSGLSSGFGDEDSYNLYDKALFNGSSANTIYRPKRGQEDFAEGVSKEKITGLLNQQPHRGFSGTDSGEALRSGPVLFEKESDVFGMDAFLSAAKRGRAEKESEPSKKTRTD
jgi:SNW domain-containing protein 1